MSRRAEAAFSLSAKRVDHLSGVYGLDLLRFIASALGVEYAPALGRGFEARNIQVALRLHLAAMKNG